MKQSLQSSFHTVARRLVVLRGLSCLVSGFLTAQSGCQATLFQGGGPGGSTPVCQGSVVHPTLALLTPNCSPFSTNGTFSEAARTPNSAGVIVLSTQGRIATPNSAAVYTASAEADATGDIRYAGPPATLALTLQIQGRENALGQQLTNHGFTVKCGPAQAVGFSLIPMGVTHSFTRTFSFQVTNGATFDLNCSGFVATSGWQMPGGRWADWTFEVALASASISVSGQSFTLSSASLPIRYWPPAAPASAVPFGAGCSTLAGTPTTSAVGLPSIGNGAFGVDVACPTTSIGLLAVGFSPASPVHLGSGCFLLTSNDLLFLQTSSAGTARFALPIPGASGLLGFSFEVQGGNGVLTTGDIATASGLRLGIGY